MADFLFLKILLIAPMSAKLDEQDLLIKNAIAKRIKELRKSSGKKQNHFANENLDTDKQALHRLESGRGASIYSIYKFCDSIDISLKDFFDSPLFTDRNKSF
ncbi:helix-turn-helix domain-containing protein [Dyadobacter diqingensis]|uniref:helix-turn-helix domain-containing protein n=1 Tax=Dyadobacter diqingensis TaxID=2938121 RepID=UPI0020C19DF8|nr:helix-turn-helix transcriptional regulator [Dyadobacter diqingensis]